MSEKIVQVNFKYNVPLETLKEHATESAENIATKPGLRWKIWIYNDVKKEAGGVYLFEDDATAETYIEWTTDALEQNLIASDVTVKKFDVNEEATAVTRGPIADRAPSP